MGKKYGGHIRLKFIYIGMILLLVCIMLIMNYAFGRSRRLLIEQETGIISQYMNRNELALTDVMDSLRNLSAASSTNKQVASFLNQSCEGNIYSAENAARIRGVEEALTFYRNIFFDFRLHYIILGADGIVYSVTDGIDNHAWFGERFAESVTEQKWYQSFISEENDQVSEWVTPCVYNEKGEFSKEGQGEEFILFMRRIRDYNTRKFLGVSFVSFPTENLKQILIPYEGAALFLLNENGEMIYSDGSLKIENLEENFTEKEGTFFKETGGIEYLFHYIVMDGTGWKLVNMVPLSTMTEAVDKLYEAVAIGVGATAAGAGILCLAMYFYVNAPLNRLLCKVSNVNIGGTQLSQVNVGTCLDRPVLGIREAEQEINRMVDYIEELSIQTMKQKEIQQNLRFEMLRAQLNPHFLFNTLNVIKWSAMISGAGNISDMIASLGALLEHTLERGEEEVPLNEEIRVVKAWLEIKNWALKSRIQLFVEAEQGLEEALVLRFFLQPLVENAVLHGLGEKEHGELRIRALHCGEELCVMIEDNGMGMSPERLLEIMKDLDGDEKRRRVTGIGLASINGLMKMKYGEAYGLRIESEIGKGTRVYAVFPYKNQGVSHAEDNDRR